MAKSATSVERSAPDKPIDWEAYQILQLQTFKTSDPFILEVLDYALSKLLDSPNRVATGRQLANDLFRDGKRYVALRNKTTGKYFQSSAYFTELFCGNDIIIEGAPELQSSIDKVSGAINALPSKEKNALVLKLVNLDDETFIVTKLGVGKRQYRNLILNCRKKLTAISGFKEACEDLQFLEKDEGEYNIFYMLKKLSINAVIAA